MPHVAGANERNVAGLDRDAGAIGDGLKIRARDRLAGSEEFDTAVSWHVEQHPASPDREQLLGTTLQRSKVAKGRACRPSVPALLVTDGDMGERVDVRARVRAAYEELADIGEPYLVPWSPWRVSAAQMPCGLR